VQRTGDTFPVGFGQVGLRHTIAERLDDVVSLTRLLRLGVLAHIDAGKTSTTERILFEAGDRRAGEGR
jgi:hypothetical protein